MSAPVREDPKDVRFRPFRRAVFGVYFVVVGLFGLVVIVSISRSLKTMSPRPVPTSASVPVEQCEHEAREMWRELEHQRKALGETPPAVEVDERWTEFRTTWMQRFRASQAHCALDASDRVELQTTFGLVLKLMDLYTTHAVQFAGEIGPSLDKLDTRLGLHGPVHTRR